MEIKKIRKIEEILKEIPASKYEYVVNFLSWLRDSDDVLTSDEKKRLRRARTEKGTVKWKDLRSDA
jgi:hypothetical protein